MYSVCGTAVLPAVGFPIRKSADHSLFSDSPRLIAAVHVLHRLLVPRHPPCALTILTVIRHYFDPKVIEAPGDTRLMLARLCSFQGPREGAPRIGARSLKTQQHGAHETSSSAPRSGRHFGSHGVAKPARDAPAASATAPILELP